MQKKRKSNFFMRTWDKWYYEPLALLNKICKFILAGGLLLSFFFFGYVIYQAVTLLVIGGPKDELKNHIINSLELLFLAPLPFVIIGAFFTYYLVQLEPQLTKDTGYKNRLEFVAYSSFYLGLTKLLFVATLISLLSTKLLEIIDFKKLDVINNVSIQNFIVFFLIMIILISFYFLLERGLHNTFKILGSLQKKEENEQT